MSGLWRERWYPSLGGVIAAGLWIFLGAGLPAPDAVRDLYATTMSLAAITVGFLATAMSIVVAAPDSPLVRQLSRSGYLKDLVRYLKEPFLVGIAIAGICLIGFVVPQCVAELPAFGATWAMLSAWMLLGLFRVGGIFVKIIEQIGKLSNQKPPPPPVAFPADLDPK
ncbi:hypothetical protein PEC18_12245 [Paucibacter sp. O1-1]|nr:hypothetical protein [Paucibacter sp. O1-1]MDA3826587.1 hypothetical protein [Paucibacter sp. O1-1]